MIPDSILLLAINFGLASIAIGGLTLLAFVFTRRSLPVRYAILITGLGACLAAPIAITTGWLGNWGSLPSFHSLASDYQSTDVAAPPAFVDLNHELIAMGESGSGFESNSNASKPFEPTNRSSAIPTDGPEAFSGQTSFAQPKANNDSLAVDTNAQERTALPTEYPTASRPGLNVPRTIGTALGLVWVIGIMFSVASYLRLWLWSKRLVHACVPVHDPRLKRLVADRARNLGLNRDPELLTNSWISVPTVTGFRNPKLIIPGNLLNVESESELQLILAHELAHVWRKDHRTLLVQAAVSCIYWWNPLLHYVSSELSRVRELICDDIAVESCGLWKEYARSIVSIADNATRLPHQSVQLGMSAGDLEQRISRLLSRKGEVAATHVSRKWKLALVAIGMIGVASLVVAQVPEYSNTHENRQDSISPTESTASGGISVPIVSNTTPIGNRPQEPTPQDIVIIGKPTAPLCKTEGVVWKTNGVPAKNAVVEIVSREYVIGKFKTDQDGKFQFLYSPSSIGWHGVVATSADGLTQTFAARGVFQKAPPDSTLNLELRLEKLTNHTVQVNDQNGNGLANVQVFGCLGPACVYRLSGTTDPKGKYVFQLPASESVDEVIAFSPEHGLDYKSYVIAVGQENRLATETNGFPADHAETLVLKGTSPFTVRVEDESGNPIEGVSVYPWLLEKAGFGSLNLAGITSHLLRMTDEEGQATIEWFPNWQKKQVTIWPSKTGYDRPRGYYSPTVDNGQTTIRLVALTSVRGEVVDEQGNPVPGIQVAFSGRKSHEQHRETRTDENGKYELRVRPSQSIIITVVEQETDELPRVSDFVVVDVPSPDAAIDNCNLKLTKPVRVRGKILNSVTGKLVSGHRMVLSRYAMTGEDYETLARYDPAWHTKSYGARSFGVQGWADRWRAVPVIPCGGFATETGEFELNLAPGVYVLRPNDGDQSQCFVVNAQDEMEIDFETKAGSDGITTDWLPLP